MVQLKHSLPLTLGVIASLLGFTRSEEQKHHDPLDKSPNPYYRLEFEQTILVGKHQSFGQWTLYRHQHPDKPYTLPDMLSWEKVASSNNTEVIFEELPGRIWIIVGHTEEPRLSTVEFRWLDVRCRSHKDCKLWWLTGQYDWFQDRNCQPHLSSWGLEGPDVWVMGEVFAKGREQRIHKGGQVHASDCRVQKTDFFTPFHVCQITHWAQSGGGLKQTFKRKIISFLQVPSMCPEKDKSRCSKESCTHVVDENPW